MIAYFAIVLNPGGRLSTTGSPPGGVGRGRSAGQRKALAARCAFGSGLTGVVKIQEEIRVRPHLQGEMGSDPYYGQMGSDPYFGQLARLLIASLRRSTCGQGNLTRPICRPSLMSP